MVAADWSDADNQWIVTVDNDGRQEEITCSFLFACSGYYNYDEGYSPAFEGAEDFQGTIMHPQQWPEDLDYAGKRVVVIGSGATAVTLIPALVNSGAGHVTMLQRSPTYIGSLPLMDPVAERANRLAAGQCRARREPLEGNRFQHRAVPAFPASSPTTCARPC